VPPKNDIIGDVKNG